MRKTKELVIASKCPGAIRVGISKKIVMARLPLPPGFRFHPTDVELIMYYLKRKVMGKKLVFDALTELNIYKFAPWDLPGTIKLIY